MEAPEVKLELDGEEGEQIYGVEPHADDVEGKASIEAEIGEDWADRGPLAARLRRRALYHLRVGPTTVLPLLLVLHDPRQIEAFKPPSAEEDEGEVADDVECKRSSGDGSAQFLRALTMALRDVLMAYLVSSTTNGRVWLSVPSVSSASSSSSSSSGGRRFFSVPGRSDVRFTYRFAPTTPRYAVMTKSSPSSGHKRRSLSSTSTSSTRHGDDDREHRAQKKPRQDDAGDEEEKAKVNEFEERNEAKEDDGESSVGGMSGSEEQDGLASDGEEEDDDEEEEEGQDVDEEDDEEGLSEDELLERRRKKQMKQLADSYRGYSVTPHTLVVETLSAAQAATMDDILEHAATAKSPPPAHKLSHYFGGGNGNGNGGSSGAAAKTTAARGGGKRRAPAGRKSAGAATSKTKAKTNSRPKKRLSN